MKKYKITGMDCPSCASMLELDLDDAGIKSSCNFAKSTLEIKEGNAKNAEEIIKKSGYNYTLLNE